MLQSCLCDYSDACIVAKGTKRVANTAATGVDANSNKKQVVFKSFAPFTDCMNKIKKYTNR